MDPKFVKEKKWENLGIDREDNGGRCDQYTL